ncbi:hypothetical protein [Microseira sp. BLCC-F43]|jgi:hypothetical protein
MADNSNSFNDKSQTSILPRTAWKSELGFLKAMLKAKQALDKREKATLTK